MTDQFMATPQDFLERVLTPDYDDFFNNPASLRLAFHLSTSLHHMHEWIYAWYRTELEQYFGTILPNAYSVWLQVEAINADFGYIRDIANASKHFSLIRSSTPARHVSNTVIQTSQLSGRGNKLSENMILSGGNVVADSGGRDLEFDPLARALYAFWKSLIAQMP